MKTVYRYNVRIKLKITAKRFIAEKRQKICRSKLARNKKGWLKKTPKGVYILVIFLAALLSVFYYIGWLEPIKEFIKNIFQPK